MKKTKKLLVTGALSLLLLAETVTAVPAASVGASAGQPKSAVSAKAYDAAAPVSDQQPDIALRADNKIFWINAGATYRSGATLQFYATGAGYNPEEPQQLNPVKNSTRYVPVNWTVGSKRGSWREQDREFAGGGTSASNGAYVPAEYRFRNSFTLKTNGPSAVPFTLKVIYQK